MWPVSDLFLKALLAAPQFVAKVTVTVPGGSPVEVQLESGQLTVDSSQNIRRQCNLTVQGDSDTYDLIMTPGSILDISAGVRYSSATELVPVFHGEVTGGTQDLGAGTVAITGGDMMVRLARNAFTTVYPAVANSTRVATISAAVTAAIPGTIILNTSSDTGTVGTATSWASQQSPVNIISDLTKDGGTEGFFRPDGAFVIRDRPVLDSPPVWTLSRTLKTAQRARPTGSLVNAVVVTPGAADGSQTWPAQVIELTDTSSPLHKSKIGVSPYFWSSPTAETVTDALIAGRALLTQLVGASTTLALGSVTNPALEGGDVMTVIAPGLGQEPAQSFRHFVDAYTLDFTTGSMSLGTRTAQVASA